MCHILQHKRYLFSRASKNWQKARLQEIHFREVFAANTVGLWNRDEHCLNKFYGLLFIWILTIIKSLTSSIENLWIANGGHVVFLSQKLINYTLTITPWEHMNTKGAILASFNGRFYFFGVSFFVIVLSNIWATLLFWDFISLKKKYTKKTWKLRL